MRLEQMEYFLTVAEHKNITAAAKKLFISQPALSKQMALLEEELGVTLFVRTGRGVALTAAGLQFEKDLKKVRIQLERAKERVISMGKAQESTLQVGCFEGDSIDDFFPEFYGYLKKQNPDITVKLKRAAFPINDKALIEGDLDLLLIFSVENKWGEGYLKQPVFTRKAGMVYSTQMGLPDDRELTVEDFRNRIFLTTRGRYENSLFQHDLDVLRMNGIPDPKIEVVDGFMTLLTYLNMGYGYCILSTSSQNLNKDLRLYFPPHDITMDIVAVWKEENQRVTDLMRNFRMDQ